MYSIFSNTRSCVRQVGATTAVGAAFLAAFMWPATLISSASLIDNNWSMVILRAERAGEALAEILMDRVQGKRPVTLVGYSIGARVIFYALQHLFKLGRGLNGELKCAGVVDSVFLLGPLLPHHKSCFSMCFLSVSLLRHLKS